MSATCLYVFKKGPKTGQYCPTHPMFGNYCAKHKHHDPEEKRRRDASYFKLIKEHERKEAERKEAERKEAERKETSLILDRFREDFLINWDSCIVFKKAGIPIGKLSKGNIYPLAKKDIDFLIQNNILSSEIEYLPDFSFFFDEYYPENLDATFTDMHTRVVLPYPYVIDTRTYFLYKYNERTRSFDFHKRYRSGDTLESIETVSNHEYLNLLLDTIVLRGLDVSPTRRPPVKPVIIEPDTFNLQRQVECKFFRLEEQDTCVICLENCTVYYTNTCEKPHFCCQSCWKSNIQNICPVCRKNIYN